jgi:hypothetical protein
MVKGSSMGMPSYKEVMNNKIHAKTLKNVFFL